MGHESLKCTPMSSVPLEACSEHMAPTEPMPDVAMTRWPPRNEPSRRARGVIRVAEPSELSMDGLGRGRPLCNH